MIHSLSLRGAVASLAPPIDVFMSGRSPWRVKDSTLPVALLILPLIFESKEVSAGCLLLSVPFSAMLTTAEFFEESLTLISQLRTDRRTGLPFAALLSC